MITVLLSSLLIITAVNVAAYIWAFFKQSDHLTDISYSLCFIGLTAYLLISEGSLTPGRLMLFAMVFLWGCRLGGFLFYRIHKMGKDYRFDAFRSSWAGFLKFWILQSISIWIISLPIIMGMSKTTLSFSLVGFLIWMAGWITESVADYQKFRFKSSSINKDRFISTGLYRFVRHPNYTGEILCWVGVFIYVVPALNGMEWLSIISPIWIVALLLFISGIPLIDKNAEIKYGNDPTYKAYRSSTKALIPGVF
ncbi:MAG: DUF1295 domain-containing protein [Saprospiraceae bacterium]|nr:DUF1295 domain-containing protein [Saprospiraceae bacterium]